MEVSERDLKSGAMGSRKLKVTRAYAQYSVGAIIYPTASLADWLVKAGFAALVPDEKPRGRIQSRADRSGQSAQEQPERI